MREGDELRRQRQSAAVPEGSGARERPAARIRQIRGLRLLRLRPADADAENPQMSPAVRAVQNPQMRPVFGKRRQKIQS